MHMHMHMHIKPPSNVNELCENEKRCLLSQAPV
jgi:hypothetical protein